VAGITLLVSSAPTPSALPVSGPCANARTEVDSRCGDAERLAQAAVAHQQRVRDVKRQLQEVVALRDADARVRDRRQLTEAKDEARQTYHTAVTKARDRTDIHEAARVWLRDIARLNRQLVLADKRADDVFKRAAELEHSLPGIELAADAARIAAEAAQVACLDARRVLAACEEDAQRRIHGGTPQIVYSSTAVPAAGDGLGARNTDRAALVSATASRTGTATAIAAAPAALTAASSAAMSTAPAAATSATRGMRPISLVLRGDRETLLALALRLADETGLEAGRLQLLLLELREAIAARALEDCALRFPADHPFWSQFPSSGSRQVAVSLAAMGYRFNGHDGWEDGKVPSIRELSFALSHVGLDPRALRRPDGQEAVDNLWQGTTVVVEEYLASKAPRLELADVTAALGPRAERLSELWDMWGRLRPLLRTPPA